MSSLVDKESGTHNSKLLKHDIKLKLPRNIYAKVH